MALQFFMVALGFFFVGFLCNGIRTRLNKGSYSTLPDVPLFLKNSVALSENRVAGAGRMIFFRA